MQQQYGNDIDNHTFNMFYSGHKQENLDIAVCAKDGKKYISGTAQYWISNVNPDFCSKAQFVLADLICYNYSVYGKTYSSSRLWFPITYIYDNTYNSAISTIAKKMISQEYLQEILPLFNYENADAFIAKFKSIEESSNGKYKEYRYPNAFESASLLGDFIKAEKIANLR